MSSEDEGVAASTEFSGLRQLLEKAHESLNGCIFYIGLDDPTFASCSESLLDAKLSEGLLICPVTFVELAPAFSGHL